LAVTNDATVDAGAGNDDVTITDSSADEFFLFLGSGNDTLSLSGNTANKVHLFGGAGTDTLDDDGTSVCGSIDINSF